MRRTTATAGSLNAAESAVVTLGRGTPSEIEAGLAALPEDMRGAVLDAGLMLERAANRLVSLRCAREAKEETAALAAAGGSAHRRAKHPRLATVALLQLDSALLAGRVLPHLDLVDLMNLAAAARGARRLVALWWRSWSRPPSHLASFSTRLLQRCAGARAPPDHHSKGLERAIVLQCGVPGPVGTGLEGAIYALRIELRGFRALPLLQFTNPPFVHTNVYPSGELAIKTIHGPALPWSFDIYRGHHCIANADASCAEEPPQYTLAQLLTAVHTFLATPNHDDPANKEASLLLQSSRREYDTAQRRFAEQWPPAAVAAPGTPLPKPPSWAPGITVNAGTWLQAREAKK